MKTPWHFWLIAALALLWFMGGAFDYIMMKTENPEYMSALPPEYLPYMAMRPWWFDIAWPISVWGSIVGALLLLLRSRHAVTAFGISLIAYLACCLSSYVLAAPKEWEIGGAIAVIFGLVIGISIVLAMIYSRHQRSNGILS